METRSKKFPKTVLVTRMGEDTEDEFLSVQETEAECDAEDGQLVAVYRLESVKVMRRTMHLE